MSAHVPRLILDKHAVLHGAVGDDSLTVELDAKSSHHILRVLRATSGDSLEIFFKDSDRCFSFEINTIEQRSEGRKKTASLGLVKAEEVFSRESSRIHLIAGTPKQTCCDEIVRRGIEAGADSITFFTAEFSQSPVSSKHQKRLLTLRDEACSLSRSPRYPQLDFADSLEEALHKGPGCGIRKPPAQRLILCGPYEETVLDSDQAPVITEHLAKSVELPRHTEKSSSIRLENLAEAVEIYIVLGPEGGLSKSEIGLALNSYSFERISLGPRVFRTDTAAIVACSIAKMIV